MTTGLDLRTTVLGGAAWAGALIGLHLTGNWWWLGTAAGVGAAMAATAARWRRARRLLVAGCLIAAAVAAGSAAVRVDVTGRSVAADLAGERAVVQAVLNLRSDPVTRSGRFGEYVVVRARLASMTGRGVTVGSGLPVLVIGESGWQDIGFGTVVSVGGRLAPARTPEYAAVLTVHGDPRVEHGPGRALQAADALRDSIRRSSAAGPRGGGGLVPALVAGDEQGLDARLVEDFQTAGLTHLTAVSGTNLTIVLAFVLLAARWAGVRGRGLVVVGVVGVVGFVLLARPEPSVVRAAVMGVVVLLGLGAGGRATGVRALGAAVLVLVLVDPWLAAAPGFALSVLATGGILFLAPVLCQAMARWSPQPVAEAIAVPVAAQLACTPLVAVLSGEVSLVSVAANLLAAPAVGPATVLGLAGGLAGLVVAPAGAVFGWAAAWSAEAIVAIAELGAGLPGAAVTWSTGAAGITMLAVLCLGLALVAPRLLADPRTALVAFGVLVLAALRPWGGIGWPPEGWVMVMCDVGQGDALVLSAGPHEAVVVDAGPDPAPVDRCLDRLGVRSIPAVVLTHFHADHVSGLPGVLDGRRVAEVQVSPLPEPTAGAADVTRWTSEVSVPVRVPAYGETATAGSLTWRVLAPRRVTPDEPNDASLVLLAETAGIRLLLTGDVEPAGQAALSGEPIGPVDVLKVPHHGSRFQDEGLLLQWQPRVALVSAGRHNDYGHPAPELLELLEDAGTLVRRTDQHGDVAVVVDEGVLRVTS